MQLNCAKKWETEILTKPIFMTTKRSAGRNGAVRFLIRTEDIESNSAQKIFLLKIPTGFLDKHISNLIYNTKQAIFEEKWKFCCTQ